MTGRMPIAGQQAVTFESTLERDFALVTQFQKGFRSLEEQPVRIPIPAPGRSYIPDFLVNWADPREADLVEVKHLADLEADKDRLTIKFAAAEKFARTRGWRFIVATERDIRTPLLANAKFLLPFRNRAVDPGLCARLLDCLNGSGVMAAGQLLETAFPHALWRPSASALTWRHR
ncbi:MAG: TnsA endonuclease N-terminal domain-containing protein [Rhodospirillaceae bacterium]|nr:TnsA endonuclease N-terminal domain-containing protein [Rhodospirillales bacterium]